MVTSSYPTAFEVAGPPCAVLESSMEPAGIFARWTPFSSVRTISFPTIDGVRLSVSCSGKVYDRAAAFEPRMMVSLIPVGCETSSRSAYGATPGKSTLPPDI
ncbi:hypothetical protein [Kribbella caucasensis]|uniref:hypothetical protein n=1 Tax=Kribbella caucasensis TaxID=2512215 RepID=UPI00141504D6|nr:hypothetical protein [Kribbella sp. VKM Ac-2527]